MENSGEGTVIQGLDVLDIIKIADKKKNRFLVLTLQEIELVGLDPEDFKMVRKFVLDGFGEFTRSLMRALIGDFENSKYYYGNIDE